MLAAVNFAPFQAQAAQEIFRISVRHQALVKIPNVLVIPGSFCHKCENHQCMAVP